MREAQTSGILPRLGLAIASGALMPLCFAPFGWWPLIFVSQGLLWLMVCRSVPRAAVYLGMLQAMVAYGLTLAWLFLIFGAAALPLHAILASFVAVACGLTAWITRSLRHDAAKVLAAAVVWTALEYYRCEWFPLRFPWATPGTALGPTWLSPLVGVYGAGFAVVLASAALAWPRTRPAGVVAIAALMLLGCLRPGPVEPSTTHSLRVALVQSEECVTDSYVRLTEAALDGKPQLIVWPEYALPFDVRQMPGSWQAVTALSQQSAAVMVVGTQTEIPGNGEAWHNTALVLDRGEAIGEYYKARPVHFFDDGIPGTSTEPVTTRLGALGLLVCFDADYQELARRTVAAGAGCLVVPSFDAASWSATQHLQHAALFRLRALENGRWLVCAASSGPSQIVDPHGNTRAMLPVMQQGVLTGKIETLAHRTWFTRCGWLFPWLVCAAAVLLVARTIRVEWLARRMRLAAHGSFL